MKRLFAVTAWLVGIAFASGSVLAQRTAPVPAPAPVSQALEQEIKRAFDLLRQKGDPVPYFIGYSVRENDSVDMEASLGALRTSQRNRSRLLDIDVRVGDYDLDNTHQI